MEEGRGPSITFVESGAGRERWAFAMLHCRVLHCVEEKLAGCPQCCNAGVGVLSGGKAGRQREPDQSDFNPSYRLQELSLVEL